MAELTQLFEPVVLGPVRLPNRVFVAPHTTNFSVAGEHHVTDRHVDYLRARGAGGAGLVITEGIRVHPTSLRRLGLQAYEDDAVPGLARLADAVHEGGAALFAQLLHTGRHTGDERWGAWAPSAVPWTTGAAVPHAMRRQDIATVVDGYAAAAGRVLSAGFDGMEVQLGHGHLPQQFLSPLTNDRDDEYGGSAENRLRFAEEILRAVREVVGDRAAVGIRISADELLPGGLGPDEMVEVVGALRATVAIDFLHVSHSAYVGAPSLDTQMADMTFPTAAFRAYPARFKREFPDVPVLAVCRIDDLATGADIVAAGDADLVGMARGHIADPSIVAKATGAAPGRVRSCIACNHGCNSNLELVMPITCTVNPEAGLERRWSAARDVPADPRDVLVVGGGPAGLEAAVAAARRGHRVQLWEAAAVLGGRVRHAAALPGRSRFGLLIEELALEAADAGVEIVLARRATAPAVMAAGVDTVVLATGAVEPPVPANAAIPVRAVLEAVEDPGSLGGHVLVIDELGTWVAAGVAELLAEHGAQVDLIAGGPGLAWNVTVYSRLSLLDRLADRGVALRPLRRYVGGAEGTAQLEDAWGSPAEVLTGLTAVVRARPAEADDLLLDDLEALGYTGEVHVIGDAYAPRTCLEAVYDGRVAGTAIGALPDPALTALAARRPYATGRAA
ncbi:MAG: FAD-dependent oxidoreductase [Solirubrobacteraceae bacterium]